MNTQLVSFWGKINCNRNNKHVQERRKIKININRNTVGSIPQSCSSNQLRATRQQCIHFWWITNPNINDGGRLEMYSPRHRKTTQAPLQWHGTEPKREGSTNGVETQVAWSRRNTAGSDDARKRAKSEFQAFSRCRRNPLKTERWRSFLICWRFTNTVSFRN